MIRKAFYLMIALGLLMGNPWMVSMAESTSAAYSSATGTVVVGGTTYTTNFKTSSGVTINYDAGTATSAPNSFNATSSHSKGDKTYGMDSEGGPVYFVTGTGVGAPAVTTGGDFSGWSTI